MPEQVKTIILCGGLGTRLAEETHLIPKPMVRIGDRPMLWHIMQCYARHGFEDFILALGYKSEVIKRYFLDYHLASSDVRVNLQSGEVKVSEQHAENWSILMKETGANSMTGGRLLRLQNELREEGTFMLTYGDGLANVDLKRLLAYHRAHGQIATITAVRPPARFGHLSISGDQVAAFDEKPQIQSGWINGGFFVFEPTIFDYLENDQSILERSPLERLAKAGQMRVYRHDGFWQCMDTIRDRQYLESLCAGSDPLPWMCPVGESAHCLSKETV